MAYLVTGASGFIGRRLVHRLLRRRGAVVHVLVRDASPARVDALLAHWGVGPDRVIAIEGDLTRPGLGLSDEVVRRLRGRVRHLFHLAALYDLAATAEQTRQVNVEGTGRVVELADAIRAGTLHHVSSIAVAGFYRGVFREDMFEEAEGLDLPYFASKHEAERIVRERCRVPWIVYRPGLVVGDSHTGETDKADGPYLLFKAIQRLRGALPSWMPVLGLEGGRINIVPVDFVVAAMDHIAHARHRGPACYHLVDPQPMRAGDVLDAFCEAAHAPRPTLRVNAALLDAVPASVRAGLMALTPVRRLHDVVLKELGLPPGVLDVVNHPTRFDCRRASAALAGSGIACPPLRAYAAVLWDYWERHLDPALSPQRTLSGRVAGKVVLVTGGSSGIGLATARRLAAAGATVVICGRDAARLEAARGSVEADGHALHTMRADLSDMAEVDRLVAGLIETYGGVDLLVNNAGRSIRRAIEASHERFHDFERCMQLNYFGAIRTTMGLLPAMVARGGGQVVNVSSIGVLTHAPRFSAYLASKSALDAWTMCAASEYADRGVCFTVVNMPLVRTPMIAPTRLYDDVPALSPDEAAALVARAIVERPVRIATRLGVFGAIVHATVPRAAQVVLNTAFRMFPDTDGTPGAPGAAPLDADQRAFRQLMRGLHL